MPNEKERLEAIEHRLEAAAHQLRRIIELGQVAVNEELPEPMRRYVRDAYEDAKTALGACLGRLEEPSKAVPLNRTQGFAVAELGEELDRKLGYLNDLMRSLRWAPVRRHDGEAVLEWSNEQKEALQQELSATLNAARDLLGSMP